MSIFRENFLLEAKSKTYKVKGVKLDISDSNPEYTEQYIEKDIKTIEKNWDKFLTEVAEKFLSYFDEIREVSEDFAPEYKTVKSIKSKLVLESAKYFVDKYKSGSIVRSFDPFIDLKKYPDGDDHVPFIEAHVTDTGLVLDRVYFDG